MRGRLRQSVCRVVPEIRLVMPFPDITIQISATAVAWYGAVIATIAAAVSVYNAWRDRSHVVLEFGKNYRRPETWETPYFFVSVINRGRRPVRIDKAWVKVYGYDGEALLAESLNTTQERTLDERNPKITFWSPWWAIKGKKSEEVKTS